jgi:hypothetical protein
MRKKLCEACKAYGKDKSGDQLDTIYSSGYSTVIRLCYHHSVELFKHGQRSFIMKYQTEITDGIVPNKEMANSVHNYFVFSS